MSEGAVVNKPQLRIATVAPRDIMRALARGLRDIQRAPFYSLGFGLCYAAFGWLILFLMYRMDWGIYAYPLATGFPLVAPLAAAGLYEISRRNELNLPVSYAGIVSGIFGPNGRAVGIMAVVTTFSYIIWNDIAAAIYVGFWGMTKLNPHEIVDAVFLTPKGLVFLLVGNGIGAAIAFCVFSIMVVSMPIIFDRKVDFVTAMITSSKAVLGNPKAMLLWALIIGLLLTISLLSLFVGLIVAFPLLGHATWHVYRAVVLPADQSL